jgi:cardiolipin synthase
MQKISYNFVNGITIYRIITTPVLLLLIFTGNEPLFKWLLPINFFTDLIDGYLARKYKVTSMLGTRLDSIGDDLTVFSAIVGIFVFKFEFIKEEAVIIGTMLTLLLVQNIFALLRYGKISSFHTYLAKVAALLQGIFLILAFFLTEPSQILFYVASAITILELIEEVILVFILPEWKINVKGLYWVLKIKNN